MAVYSEFKVTITEFQMQSANNGSDTMRFMFP